MPKHEAATWFEDDAETQKLSLRNTDAETVETATMLKHEPRQSAGKADTVKGHNSRG